MPRTSREFAVNGPAPTPFSLTTDARRLGA
jgi:hypothetical protein